MGPLAAPPAGSAVTDAVVVAAARRRLDEHLSAELLWPELVEMVGAGRAGRLWWQVLSGADGGAQT